MSYTLNIFKTVTSSVVPFSDYLPGMHNPKCNEKSERTRLNVAKSMKKAIKEGKLDNKYSEPVNKLEEDARGKIANASLSKNQYIYDQVSKLSPALNAVLPGAGNVVCNVSKVAKVKNLYQYAEQSPSRLDTAFKVGGFVASTLMTATSPFWMPIVTPIVTPTVIAAGAALVVGTSLGLDAFNYVRKHSIDKITLIV